LDKKKNEIYLERNVIFKIKKNKMIFTIIIILIILIVLFLTVMTAIEESRKRKINFITAMLLMIVFSPLFGYFLIGIFFRERE